MLSATEARKLIQETKSQSVLAVEKALAVIELKIRAKAALGQTSVHYPFENINSEGMEAEGVSFLNCLSYEQIDMLIAELKQAGYRYSFEATNKQDSRKGKHTISWA